MFFLKRNLKSQKKDEDKKEKELSFNQQKIFHIYQMNKWKNVVILEH